MRILFCSYDFYPRVGGTETAGMALVQGMSGRGHAVTVVTASAGDADEDARFPFRVMRRPSRRDLLAAWRASDLVWHNQVSLRLLWPQFLVPRPLLFTHHTPFATDVGHGPRHGAIKRLACRMGTNAFVSAALRDQSRLPGPVIYNSYDGATFRRISEVERCKDVAFLGRIAPEKGIDLLLDAVKQLQERGRTVSTTIIGEGPQRSALQDQASALALDSVRFVGGLRGEGLARCLNEHRLLVMPSRWFEALGIAAIEAMACGCVVIGTATGGIPEVVGPCGVVVPKDDAGQIAHAIESLLSQPEVLGAYAAAIPAHLAMFSGTAMIDAYESLIAQIVRRGA